MHKRFQWAIAGMVFVIMVVVAGPPILKWNQKRQEVGAATRERNLQETQESIEYLTRQSAETSGEDVVGNLYSRCQESRLRSSQECVKYFAYLSEHNISAPDDLQLRD